jgi:hypothetical protein
MDNETPAAVEAAKAPETFDILSFIEATAYPTETVTVFGAPKEATEYVRLVQERSVLDAIEKKTKEDTAKIAELTQQLEPLAEVISKSAMIFTLRGMPPGIVQQIIEVPEGEEESVGAIDRDNDLVAKSIIKVTNAAGVEDTRVWDKDSVAKLRFYLKEGEFGKLATGVGSVNFNAMVFDQATDAGFSGRSSDVA